MLRDEHTDMDFDSPDGVEKDFPGLYASETGGGRNSKHDDDDFSEGEHEKLSKKELLLGRRKEKKDKKDRGYATLDGESSPEEEPEVKSPSKTKKSKAFKFATTKSKEKREKSRDKDTSNRCSQADANKSLDCGDSAVNVTGNTSTTNTTNPAIVPGQSGSVQHPTGGTLSAQLHGTLHKKDKKDKKDKEKKDKSKDKDKKDKKSKQSSLNTDVELLELGDAQPIFGVSLGLAVERSRCHDQVNLPLVVRDCIDYLQESGLHSPDIYKVDAGRARLQQLKRAYNNRESSGTGDWDVPTACGLLKLFCKELPEPILTTDLCVRFEEAASLSLVTEQHAELATLVSHLPSYNQTLLAWTLCHFDAVIQHERQNKTNAQSLAMLLSPALQMSHRLLVCMLCHCTTLFEGCTLTKYVPPITAASPNLPDTSDAIAGELRKQDSLLNQIHAEMNAGYVTKKREEQLWEVQRIITQLKRKLRTFEKKADAVQPPQKQPPSHTDSVDGAEQSGVVAEAPLCATQSLTVAPVTNVLPASKPSCSDDESIRTAAVSADSTPRTNNTGTKSTPHATPDACSAADAIINTAGDSTATAATTPSSSGSGPDLLTVHSDTGMLLLPAHHPDGTMLLRLQLENVELAKWKAQLQERINAARADVVWLRTALRQLGEEDHLSAQRKPAVAAAAAVLEGLGAEELSGYERIVAQYAQENALLEHKKQLLVREVFDGNVELIQMQVDWSMKYFKY